MKSNKIYFSLVFVFYTFFALAQEQLIHQPKVYVSKSGYIFWNKKLPVYLKVSTSPDDTAKSYWVKSRLTAAYADPFFFDTEGENFLRTKWAVDKKTKKIVEPRVEVTWGVYNDSRTPQTKINYLKSKYYEKDRRLYFGSSLKVAFSSFDELSGVEGIYYSINKAEYSLFKDTLTFDQEGDYNIKFYAVDRVGNVEKVQGVNITIDASAPTTELIQNGDWNDNVASARSSLKLKSTDAASGVKNILYSIDDSKEKPYQGTIQVGELAEGQHSITYYATDGLGNAEEASQFDFYIDKKAPLISIETVGDKYTVNGKEFSSGRTRIKLTAVDNKSGVKEIWYSINGEKYQLYDKPFYLSGKAGNRSIKYYAIDHVNNKTSNSDGNNMNISTPYLDLTGPKLNHNFSGPVYKTRDTLFISPTTKISLSATDEESGLQKITYKINGAEEVDYTAPIVLDKEGYYEIAEYGYDNVNNSNRKEFAVMVDTTGPEHFPRFSIAPHSHITENDVIINVYPMQVEVYLAATDEMVGNHKILYSINNGPEKEYTMPIKGFERGKRYDIKVKAFDYLENISTSNITFEILKGK